MTDAADLVAIGFGVRRLPSTSTDLAKKLVAWHQSPESGISKVVTVDRLILPLPDRFDFLLDSKTSVSSMLGFLKPQKALMQREYSLLLPGEQSWKELTLNF